MMNSEPLPPQTSRAEPATFVKANVCVIAAIGFAFDSYGLLMSP